MAYSTVEDPDVDLISSEPLVASLAMRLALESREIS